MKQITQFPRIPFAVLPTPLYKLEAISRYESNPRPEKTGRTGWR